MKISCESVDFSPIMLSVRTMNGNYHYDRWVFLLVAGWFFIMISPTQKKHNKQRTMTVIGLNWAHSKKEFFKHFMLFFTSVCDENIEISNFPIDWWKGQHACMHRSMRSVVSVWYALWLSTSVSTLESNRHVLTDHIMHHAIMHDEAKKRTSSN